MKHHYTDVVTACETDRWSQGNVEPKGTKLKCDPVRPKNISALRGR